MLVVSRKSQEWIKMTVAGQDGPIEIVVKLVESRKGRARIGIDAPQAVRITPVKPGSELAEQLEVAASGGRP